MAVNSAGNERFLRLSCVRSLNTHLRLPLDVIRSLCLGDEQDEQDEAQRMTHAALPTHELIALHEHFNNQRLE